MLAGATLLNIILPGLGMGIGPVPTGVATPTKFASLPVRRTNTFLDSRQLNLALPSRTIESYLPSRRSNASLPSRRTSSSLTEE